MDLSTVIKHFDVLPSDNRDLRDPGTQQIGAPDKGVITNGIVTEIKGLAMPAISNPICSSNKQESAFQCGAEIGQGSDCAAPQMQSTGRDQTPSSTSN